MATLLVKEIKDRPFSPSTTRSFLHLHMSLPNALIAPERRENSGLCDRILSLSVATVELVSEWKPIES